jgi:hypothetical protein
LAVRDASLRDFLCRHRLPPYLAVMLSAQLRVK